jgi:hypothetical protein
MEVKVIMEYFLYFLPVLFLFHAIVYLFISLKAIIKNKPFIINSRWINLLMVISFVPFMMLHIIDLVKTGAERYYSLLLLLQILFFVLFMIFLYFVIKGYSIYCVNDVDFRNSVVNSLNSNSIKFEEKMNKIELVDINNELNVSFAAWLGCGMIKIKNKKDKLIFKKIIDGIKIYFKENDIESKKIVAVFYLIFGMFFIAFSIGFIILIRFIPKGF